MPKIDPTTLPAISRSGYIAPHHLPVAGRHWRAIGAAAGLTHFGANLVTLEPGAWSSQRHWHSHEDELVVMISGEAVLVEGDGETPLRPGDIATFTAGAANGHHLQNRSTAPAVFLAIGNDDPVNDQCHYPDVDMHYAPASGFTTKPSGPA
jgi:uncharacterized cupin superfamily protein